jgi:hypothetical protein
MREKTKKTSNFFERISQIIDYYEIKSVKSFACDYLGYDSSQKINRLKDKNTNPSYEILNDISNKFDSINPEWLLTGKGEMLRNADTIAMLTELPPSRAQSPSEYEVLLLREQLAGKDREIRELNREVGALHHELDMCKKNIAELHAALPKPTTSTMLERELSPQPYPTFLAQAESIYEKKRGEKASIT